jgi:hypothetical protein
MKGLIAILLLIFTVGAVPVEAAKRPETLSVQIKKEKRFGKGKLTVRFVELVEDSRCPVDVNCIWAGNAVIKVRVTKNGRSKILTLETNGPANTVNVEGYSMKLVAIAPAMRSNARIDRNRYVATIEFEKLAK